MAAYSYDEDGQSLFFILTGLLVVLIPWTWISVRVSQGTLARAIG